MAAFGALWLAVLFGIPPFLQIVTRLPVFSSGHNSRLTVLYVLAVALLAGWGLDDLVGGALARARAAPGARAVGGRGSCSRPCSWSARVARRSSALGDALEVAWGFADPPGVYLNPNGGRACIEPCTEPGNVIRLASLIVLADARRGRARCCSGCASGGGSRPRWFAVLAILLVCVDLFHAGMGYNPAIDRDYAGQPATAGDPTAGARTGRLALRQHGAGPAEHDPAEVRAL